MDKKKRLKAPAFAHFAYFQSIQKMNYTIKKGKLWRLRLQNGDDCLL